MRFITCCFLLLAPSLMLASDEDSHSSQPNGAAFVSELGLLGKWTATVLQVDGIDQFENPSVVVVEFRVNRKLDIWYRGRQMPTETVRVDPTKRPAHLTILPKWSGSYPPGVYQLNGDQLTVVLGSPHGKRPGSIQPKEHEELIVLRLNKR